jgi:uncharacterized protein YdgA (DUF945 family)
VLQGIVVKKGVVALLLVLAIIVLVSPAIVGRLAENSMDENLDWAATESQEIIVTSQGFDRGWFSSEGQHRIEIRQGGLQDMLLALANSEDPADVPALIIDTHLDHGLVPLTSMSRDEGTLLPGLGSAVSTLSVELASGEILPLPGTIYSDVSLTGALRSRFVLDAGAHEFAGANSVWGDTAISFTSNPTTGALAFDGRVASLAIAADGDFVELGEMSFDGELRKSRFGFSVGNANFALQSMLVEGVADDPVSFGPLAVETRSAIDGDRVSGRTTVRLDSTPFAQYGRAGIAASIHLIDADGASLGKIIDAYDALRNGGNSDDFMFVVQDDLQRLFARGFELQVDQLDLVLAQGTIATKIHLVIGETDVDRFTWPAVLLALDANLDINMPAELVEYLTTTDPQMHTAIAGGFLRKNGDLYEMQAAFKKGLLTVNGAPMPLPIPGLR